VAKKKKLESEDEVGFEFPEFDEGAFIAHETEQTVATVIALGVAILLAVVSFAIDSVAGGHAVGGTDPLVFVPPLVGVAVIIASPFVIGRLRPASTDYTKGDWASLLLIEIFGWLGIWFVLTDVFLH
jgi:predicted tellurium resistance membrane protein TerC